MHLLNIMQFDRLLAALVLMKYEAMICDIVYRIIKSLVFALDTSACRLHLVFESINIYTSPVNTGVCQKKRKLFVRHTHLLRKYE